MPEKKSGVFDIIIGVFKGRKELYQDIVAEADSVIANYLNCRRNMILGKYKRKSRFMGFVAVAVSLGVLYLIYRLAT